ncbi:MAG TPA: BolA family protein [Steroidobacteraceae bacterium]|nr:BolA family protein [Steroidobacteraceae bacterium]
MIEARLRELLQRALAPVDIHIRNDSAAHAGHAGAREGAHLAVTLIADGFAGRTLMQRHRMVYEAAAPLLAGGIHALQIHALTPAEAAARSPDSASTDPTSPRSS